MNFPIEHRQPSHREELERELVRGAAVSIASYPEKATPIAEGIKIVLAALHPAPPVTPIVQQPIGSNAAKQSPGAQADQRMESEITAAGLDAPRVTADQIQALMDRVVFRYEHPEGATSTFAHAFLGGFYLATGHSACVSPENYKPALGQKYAREQAEPKARDKLWELEGYALHKQLAAQGALINFPP